MADSQQQFRNYWFSLTRDGRTYELARDEREVVCLAFDMDALHFVQIHVLMAAVSRPGTFHQRGRVARAIHGEYLGRVIDAGEDEGSWFYATSYLGGERLDLYLGRHTELPGEVAISLCCGVVEALRELAETGLPTDVGLRDFVVVADARRGLKPILMRYLLGEEEEGKPPTYVVSKTALERRARTMKRVLKEAEPRKGAGVGRRVSAAAVADALADLFGGNFRQVTAELGKLRRSLAGLQGEGAGAIKLGELLRPVSVLREIVPGLAAINRLVSGEYHLKPERDRVLGGIPATGRDGGLVRVQPLLPQRLTGKVPIELVRGAQQRLTSGSQPHLLRVVRLWEDEECPCYAETAPVGGTTLGALIEARGGEFAPGEVRALLVALDTALREAELAGALTYDPLPVDVVVVAGEGAGEGDRGLLGGKRFGLRLRCYPTVEHLMSAPPAAGVLEGGVTRYRSAAREASGSWFVALAASLFGAAGEEGKLGDVLRDFAVAAEAGRPQLRSGFLEALAEVVGEPEGPAETGAGREAGAVAVAVAGRGDGDGDGDGERGASKVSGKTAGKTAGRGHRPQLEPIRPRREVAAEAGAQGGGVELGLGALAEDYSDEHAPGLAEVLFQRGGLGGVEVDYHEEVREEWVGDLGTGYYGRARGLPLLWSLVLLLGLSAALAAALAHLSGRASWLREGDGGEAGAGTGEVVRARPAEVGTVQPAEVVTASGEVGEGARGAGVGAGGVTDGGGREGGATGSFLPGAGDTQVGGDVRVEGPVAGGAGIAEVSELGGALWEGVGGAGAGVPAPAGVEVPRAPAAGELEPGAVSAPAPPMVGEGGEGPGGSDGGADGGGVVRAQPAEIPGEVVPAQPAEIPGEVVRARPVEGGAGASEAVRVAEGMLREGATAEEEREAVRILQGAVSAGDRSALLPLARLHLEGRGTPVDPAYSVGLLRQLADVEGDAEAMYLLGVIYSEGRGVPRQEAMGMTWMRRAATAGHLAARAWCEERGVR